MATSNSVQDLLLENTKNWRLKIDDTTSTTITYFGKADPGTLTSEAKWQIYILDETSGLDKKYANGSDSYLNVWDNRVSITYT